LKSACGYFALMRPISHHAGVAYVTWALAKPPFDLPEWRRTTMEPESPVGSATVFEDNKAGLAFAIV